MRHAYIKFMKKLTEADDMQTVDVLMEMKVNMKID